MAEQNRPEIPQDEYKKEVGSDMPAREPLELLPEREWLNADIIDVKYQVAMFNNQIQYVSYKNDDGEDVAVLNDEGEKIMRKEFEFTFSLTGYKLPNGDPRKAWLRLGASFGEKAHLPQFLMRVLTTLDGVNTPESIIEACKGKTIKLQLKNKESKDGTKTYQNVVWDAVKSDETPTPPAPEPEPTQPTVSEPVEFTPEQQAKVDADEPWDE